MSKPLTGGQVKPQDPVKVYATAKLAGAKLSNGSLYQEGEEFEVHSSIAAKLIASGKATDKAPAKSEAKK